MGYTLSCDRRAGPQALTEAYPQRKPAPRAALFSLFTATLASFSVSRSTAAFKASKSAPLTGNIPVAGHTAFSQRAKTEGKGSGVQGEDTGQGQPGGKGKDRRHSNLGGRAKREGKATPGLKGKNRRQGKPDWKGKERRQGNLGLKGKILKGEANLIGRAEPEGNANLGWKGNLESKATWLDGQVKKARQREMTIKQQSQKGKANLRRPWT